MDTSKIDRLFEKIANTVNKMIPEEWSKVLLYAEMDEEGGSVIFYYYNKSMDKLVYSLNIEDLFSINKEQLDLDENQLFDYVDELRNEVINLGQEPWTNLTMELYSTGKFEFRFDYTKFDEDKADIIQRQQIWEYKNLGIKPKNPRDLKFVEDYIQQERLEKERNDKNK